MQHGEESPWERKMRVLYCTVLYCAVLYCTVLYCTVLPISIIITRKCVVSCHILSLSVSSIIHLIQCSSPSHPLFLEPSLFLSASFSPSPLHLYCTVLYMLTYDFSKIDGWFNEWEHVASFWGWGRFRGIGERSHDESIPGSCHGMLWGILWYRIIHDMIECHIEECRTILHDMKHRTKRNITYLPLNPIPSHDITLHYNTSH